MSRCDPSPGLGSGGRDRHLELSHLFERRSHRTGTCCRQCRSLETKRERFANRRPLASSIPRSRFSASTPPQTPRDTRSWSAAGRGGSRSHCLHRFGCYWPQAGCKAGRTPHPLNAGAIGLRCDVRIGGCKHRTRREGRVVWAHAQPWTNVHSRAANLHPANEVCCVRGSHFAS